MPFSRSRESLAHEDELYKVKRGPAFSSVSLFMYWLAALLLWPLRSIVSVYKVKSAFSPYKNEGEEESDQENKYAASFLVVPGGHFRSLKWENELCSVEW